MKTPKPHPDSKLTIRQCFERFYDKSDLAPLTIAKYNYDLNRWERLTDNPPIGQIDNDLAAEYRAACLADGAAAETINSNAANLKAILRLMAPPVLGNPRGRSVIEAVPYFKPVPVVRGRPRRISIDDLNKAYLACEYANYPRIGFPPPDWWRALLTVAYFTGLRKGDLLSLQRSQFDLEAGTLFFQASKTSKPDIFLLHPVAITHLRLAWLPERERFFRGAQGSGSLMYKRWHELLDKAGVEHFGLHDLRKTGASEIERIRPGMAKVFLQHAARDVTGRNYLNQNEELRETIMKMRVPEAFEYGPRIDGEIQARLRAVRQAAAEEFLAPAPRGNVPTDWQFTLHSVQYRGKWFRCTGPKNHVLQTLINSQTPVDFRQLGAALYGRWNVTDDDLMNTRIRGVMCSLRRFLRDALGLPDGWNAVPCVDSVNTAYTLSLPPQAMMGGAA